jgi:hypothetical protein
MLDTGYSITDNERGKYPAIEDPASSIEYLIDLRIDKF